jgi:plasmid replication DNA-binding protein KfrA
MESSSFSAESAPDLSLGNSRASRSLQERVMAAAEALLEQGLRPTVTRVRAAMGGGSPNDIGPALKHWKDVVLPAQGRTSALEPETVGIPPILADVVRELWSRALAAASVEIRGGAARQTEVSQSEQVRLLRHEVSMLRDRLQREAQAYGELRAQSARHEVIARDALNRTTDIERRLVEAQRTIGLHQARIEILQAQQHRSKTKGRNGTKTTETSSKPAAKPTRLKKRPGAKSKSRAGRRLKRTTGLRKTRT